MKGGKVAVVGGGNVAMDAARTCASGLARRKFISSTAVQWRNFRRVKEEVEHADRGGH